MSKFKIFAPSGIEVCTIEAVSRITTETETSFYDYDAHFVIHEKSICELPKGWVVIPEEIIVKNNDTKPVEWPSFEEAVANSKRFFGRSE